MTQKNPSTQAVLSHLYLVIGDSFLREEKIRDLLARIRAGAGGEIPVTSFQFSDTDLEQILSEARSLPFLVAAQIFRIHGAESLKTKQVDLISSYFENPNSATYMILEAETLASDHELRPLTQKKGELILLDEKQRRPSGERFMNEKLRQFGKSMTDTARRRLFEMMGDQPAFLNSVLEQLITYAGESTVIDESMVAQFEERWQELDLFQLSNSIASRDCERSLIYFHRLKDEGESDVIGLIGMLHWQIKRMWKAAKLLDDGQPQDAVMRACRISPRQAPYFFKPLRSFSCLKLENALENLFQLDWKIKTGQVEEWSGLESWLIQTTTA